MPNLASNALCSVADVKESLGIASSDTSQDNLITRKINAASQSIEMYCGRSFHVADYTEEYNGSHIDQLVLNQRPINTVTSLQYRGSSLNSDNWRDINTSYYYLDSTAGILRLLFPSDGRWNRWRVTYNAGYNDIPADLAEACATLAAYYVNNSDGQAQVSSKQEGQRRVAFFKQDGGFKTLLEDLGVDQVINSYANWPLRSE